MRYLVAAAAALLFQPSLAEAQGEAKGAAAKIEASVLAPRAVESTDERVAALKKPQDFRVAKFAEGLIHPRMLAIAEDGTVYVTRREVGDVLMLRDTDGDGQADLQVSVVQRPDLHGITIHNNAMYLASVKDVYQAPINPDGTLGPVQHIIDDLPDGGQHPNRTLKIGPDGMLYLSVGSTCNACEETNPEHAALLQITPDGRQRRIYASRLRNTVGFDWHPETGELWGMDHGTDWLGNDQPQEELNRIVEGGNYGWPYIYGDGKEMPHRDPPSGITTEQWRQMTIPMEMGYTPHAAPMQMQFYRGGQFPDEYRGDAFVAMRGSWNARPATGYEIVRIRFKDGKPEGFEPFISGFVENADSDDATHFGRPVGLAFMPDGSMLFSDDTNGVIYRVSYEGDKPGSERVAEAAPQQPSQQTLAQQQGNREMAVSLLAKGQQASFQVSSPSFQMGGEIPLHHTAFGGGFSPALEWSNLPKETKSLAVLMEDPTASPQLVNHWIAYNIPAGLGILREGLPTHYRLREPELSQGQNTVGRIGYYGPRPMDDAVHQYHFQVFALDRELDLPPGAQRQAVIDAMKGHVLGYGVLVGTFTNPAKAIQQVAAAQQGSGFGGGFQQGMGFADPRQQFGFGQPAPGIWGQPQQGGQQGGQFGRQQWGGMMQPQQHGYASQPQGFGMMGQMGQQPFGGYDPQQQSYGPGYPEPQQGRP